MSACRIAILYLHMLMQGQKHDYIEWGAIIKLNGQETDSVWVDRKLCFWEHVESRPIESHRSKNDEMRVQ